MASTLRIATQADATAVQAIYAPIVENTFISFETETPTALEMAERIKKTLEFFPYLVCEHDSQVIGYAYAGKHRERAAYQWAADVTVYIHGDFRGGGVGRALYTALIAMLTGQGFYQAFAVIALPNAGSIGIHEAFGFKLVGVSTNIGYKMGAWHDVGVWQAQLQSLDLPPRPLIPFPEYSQTAGTISALDHAQNLLRL